MEIIERQKKITDGDVVPWNENPKNVREEVLRRNAKAGYCTRHGEPTSSGRIIAKPLSKQGKKNYRKIFGHN